MGPPLEAFSPPGALGRSDPDAFGRMGSNGLNVCVFLLDAGSMCEELWPTVSPRSRKIQIPQRNDKSRLSKSRWCF